MTSRLSLLLAFSLAGSPAAVAQTAPDAVEVDPTHHHVIMENDHVRVFEVLGSPGAQSPMHSHHPLVAISLDRARARMATPDGSSFIFDLSPGQILWMEDVVHQWELLSGRLHVIAVEPKAARSGATPTPPALPANDAVAVDPTHHQIVLENDHVRVLSNLASPGARSPMHSHPPIAVVSLGEARFRMGIPDGQSMIFDLHAGQVLWFVDVVHSWELLSGQAQVIGVEVKAAR